MLAGHCDQKLKGDEKRTGLVPTPRRHQPCGASPYGDITSRCGRPVEIVCATSWTHPSSVAPNCNPSHTPEERGYPPEIFTLSPPVRANGRWRPPPRRGAPP